MTFMQPGGRSRLVLDRFLLTLDRVLSEVAMSARQSNWLNKIMHQDELHHFSVSDLAASAGVTREHLARVCREAFDQTPMQLITTARLNHAARLLEQTRRSVLDIALDAGFNHLGHFHQQFRKRFTMTPNRYRKRQQSIAL
jgi:AraC-like DNA-binding protein